MWWCWVFWGVVMWWCWVFWGVVMWWCWVFWGVVMWWCWVFLRGCYVAVLGFLRGCYVVVLGFWGVVMWWCWVFEGLLCGGVGFFEGLLCVGVLRGCYVVVLGFWGVVMWWCWVFEGLLCGGVGFFLGVVMWWCWDFEGLCGGVGFLRGCYVVVLGFFEGLLCGGVGFFWGVLIWWCWVFLRGCYGGFGGSGGKETSFHQFMDLPLEGRKEGNFLFNNVLNTFYLQLYGVGHMVKDHSDREKLNHCCHMGYSFRLAARDRLYPLSTERMTHTTTFVSPVVEHLLERDLHLVSLNKTMGRFS